MATHIVKTFFREILQILVLAVAISLLIQVTVQKTIVYERSMEPNFEEGQQIIVNKLAYKFHTPERGDVIIFHSPTSSRIDFIKRIIVLPGESVEIKEGKVIVYVDDEAFPLDEKAYVKYPAEYDMPKQEIPENEYFVLGDNRPVSNDSHRGWTVPLEDIVGKAWLSIWPQSKWGVISNYSLPEQVPP